MARLAYTFALYLLCPLFLLWYAWRGLRQPSYRRRWIERFGWIRAVPERPIWIHAVSVGEVQAALPLIRALLLRYPQRRLLVTTTTPTGSERVRAALGDSIAHAYAPLDLPGSVNRFLRRARPSLGVIMETELWPNLYAGSRRRGVPLLLVNARLSARSAAGYRWLQPLVRRTVNRLNVIAAQSAADAERFVALGAEPARVQVMGNIKYDVEPNPRCRAEGAALREQIGARPVWIAASTHEGEEEQVLAAHQRLREAWPDALLILVPRHPERFERAADACERFGFAFVRRSLGERPRPDCQVYLGDTMGELMSLYAAADVAFVGGSLVPVGGHNLLEPAALELPVLSGPQVANFRQVTDLLMAADGVEIVADAEALGARVGALWGDGERRQRLGANARAVVEANRGAVERCLSLIDGLLEPVTAVAQ